MPGTNELRNVDSSGYVFNRISLFVCASHKGQWHGPLIFTWKGIIVCVYRIPIMTSSNGNIFRVTGPLCEDFTGVRGIHRSPVNSPQKGQWRGTLMFSLICALNKRLSKHLWGWWFETPSRSLWRHCNEMVLSEIKTWISNRVGQWVARLN